MKAGTDLTEPALTDSTSRKRETRLSNQKIKTIDISFSSGEEEYVCYLNGNNECNR